MGAKSLKILFCQKNSLPRQNLKYNFSSAAACLERNGTSTLECFVKKFMT